MTSPELETQRAPPSGPVAERRDAASRAPPFPLAASGEDVAEGGDHLLRPHGRRQAGHGGISGEEVDPHAGGHDAASRLSRSLPRRAPHQRPEREAVPQLVEDRAPLAGLVADVEDVAGRTAVRGSETGPVQGGRQGPGHHRGAQRQLQLAALFIGDVDGRDQIDAAHRSRSATPN